MQFISRTASAFVLASCIIPLTLTAQNPNPPKVGACPVLPADNVWNAPVDKLPMHKYSTQYIATTGATRPLHADFTSTGYGIPFVLVPGTQPLAHITFDYAGESDPGPYPIPNNAPIETGSDAHVIVLDTTHCKLYESWQSQYLGNLTWYAGSGAVFNLNSDTLRPAGWTSADAAGLPIFPGLVRYDEVATGVINHALRVTVPYTQNTYVWPARHSASRHTGYQYPPMGTRLRLKASFNVAGYPAQVQVILNALKKYGMIVADNGSSWFISGAPDSRWNDSLIHTISNVHGSDLEVVDESSLQISSNSGQSR